MKHLVIAASLGDDDSIKLLMKAFRSGLVSKDDLASALRAHQAAVEETKSPQREAAKECGLFQSSFYSANEQKI
jgi:predicted RNA-binding protein associated with RNAse of E/G family